MGTIKLHKIYTHSAEGIVRNVGVTARCEQLRLQEHLGEARRGLRNHRGNWFRSLQRPPSVEIIEWVRPEDRAEREKYWVALFRAYGHNLVNETDGGDGTFGYRHNQDSRIKKSERMRGPGNHQFGNPKTPETRAKLSKANSGENNPFSNKIHSQESKDKNRRAHLGKKASPETKEKMRESHLAWWARKKRNE